MHLNLNDSTTPEWSAPQPDSWPDWSRASRVGLDIETCDPNLKTTGPSVRTGGFIVGVSFCLDGGKPMYLPIMHQEGGNLSRSKVMAYLREQARKFRGEIVGANIGYDLDYLLEAGIEFDQSVMFRDVLLADALINELHGSYSLDAVSKRWGLPGKDEELLVSAAKERGYDPKCELWKLHAAFVGPYAEADAELPLLVLRKQEEEIEAQNLQQVWDMETKLLPILIRMRRRGVRVDESKLGEIADFALGRAQDACSEIKRTTGFDLDPGDVWKASRLKQLADAISLKLPSTPTGKPSITADFIASCGEPSMKLVGEARRWAKLSTTYVEGIRKHTVKGRIHTTFNQSVRQREHGSGTLGARFGRLSSSNPNLQNQPARDPEIGSLWRSLYLPEEGQLWGCLDYSSQEPRLAVHYAELVKAPGAAQMGDRFRSDPDTDLHGAMAELCGRPRKEAKAIFLGMCYGMGGAKLCDALGLPTDLWVPPGESTPIRVAGAQGKNIRDQFNRSVPWLIRLVNDCKERVRETGQIRTLGGRVCRFPELPEGGYDWEHKAVNRLIQGSAGDQMKMAMVAMSEAGYDWAMRLQVHDEVDVSVDCVEQAQEIAQIMIDAVQLRVPSKVDVEIGPNWGEIA